MTRPYKCWCGSRFLTAKTAERHLSVKHEGHGVIVFKETKRRLRVPDSRALKGEENG